jgi:5-hydroxyisourate hydrolase
MIAGLTTHVLDTSRGRPAVGLQIDFSAVEPDGMVRLIRTVTTNTDGRIDAPLLGPEEMRVGRFELLFHVGAYFRALSDHPRKASGTRRQGDEAGAVNRGLPCAS